MLRLRQGLALFGLGLVVVALLGVCVDESAGFAKKKGQPDPMFGGGSASGYSSVKIFEDSQLRKAIQIARDCIRDKEWGTAVDVLQTLLKQEKDLYVQMEENDGAGKSVKRWTSVKFEANSLIGSMAIEGLQTYELKVGAEAKILLDEAKKKGNRDQIADVAQRFCHTQAGIEANEILATLYLARGQVFTAALRFEKLLQMNPKRTNLSDLTLFKASLAFKRAGDTKNFDATWERLQANLQGKPGLRVGEEVVPIAKLEEVFKQGSPINLVSVSDWPSWRGNVRNSAQANGSPPLLDTVLWKRPIFNDILDGFKDPDPDQPCMDRVTKTIKQASDANQAVLPGFFPIASNGIMVYRTHRDIRAVALRPIEIRDRETGEISKFQPGHIVWKSIPHNRSLAALLDKPSFKAKVDLWMNSFDTIPGFNSFLYDNTVIGTVVTDHRNVYAINDLAVPPHPSVFFGINQFQPQFNQYNPGELKPLMTQNELTAYDLLTGKMQWDLNQDDSNFRDSHFLSLPISVGGKLFVLNEKVIDMNQQGMDQFGRMINMFGGESELRLVCIDPNKLTQTTISPKPDIVFTQPLGTIMVNNRMMQDIGRRVNGIQLAYDEGVLVCPTNAGEVFGVDLMTRSLVWSYPYRDLPIQQIWVPVPGMPLQPNFPGMPQLGKTTTVISKWKSSPPAIQDGKVVFTAPDADSIHCISLRDGKPAWKKGQKKGDLYMAGVHNGRVLIVSETDIRALDLKTGAQLWSIYTNDLPSGQGVASKGMYYLPLKKGEILALDIVKGEVKAHNRAAAGGAAPGNLVFYENMVLSQTPTEVMAFPQLTARLDEARLAAVAEPTNFVKLTDYGELLLKNGDVQPAVEALVKVYNSNPAEPLSKRVKERLFEALTDFMAMDFNKADKDYLATYKALCNVPGDNAEEQSRKAKFFRLVGQGREAQGNLVEAFTMYKDFGALPMYRDVGIASLEDPSHKIPVNVWLRGRISGMLAAAKPEQREPLETKIADEWKDVDAKKDIEAIRSFVGMFDVPVRVGREARVRLAETIMERNEKANYLEAEMLLTQVLGSDFRGEAQTGGRALASLALLEEKKSTPESLRLAAAYYRELNREFADKAVRGTKTGSALLNELAADKRFLEFLEETSNPFGPAKLGVRDIGAGTVVIGTPGFALSSQGDQTPFAKQTRLVLDPSDTNNPKVILRDSLTNEIRWQANLGQVPMNQQVLSNLYGQQGNPGQVYHPNARFRFYQVKGHLIVCQVGVMVYCIDGDTGKKLWEMQTSENIPFGGFVQLNQVLYDAEGNPELRYQNNQTGQLIMVPLGRIGTVQASYVALLGHKGLTVVDPLKGTVMWKKPDVSSDSTIFGDEQYMFLAEANAGGAVGVGRTIRASDGEVLKVADFSPAYQNRVRTMGRTILAADYGVGLKVHLYDIIKGADRWSKQFPQGSRVLHSEDRNIIGVLDTAGMLTVLDAETGKELVSSSLVQGRITAEDFKGLSESMLLQDGERFYVALNKQIDGTKVINARLLNNISNGTRCLPVNGWVVAVYRQDGKKQVGERQVTWKKGDFAWHSYMPVQNQLIILEQFEKSPVILFTVRLEARQPNGGNQWTSVTQSLHKGTGKMVYDSIKVGNGYPAFAIYQMDLKGRTINLLGYSGSVQHYVDDGKGPPANNPGAMLNPQNPPALGQGGAFQPDRAAVVPPPNGQLLPNPRVRLRVADDVDVVPAQEIPEIRKR